MSDQLSPIPLETALRTQKMIGRLEAKEKIEAAIRNDPADKRFKLVLIKSKGGMGKTRLLEEILCAYGHPDFPCRPGASMVGAIPPADRPLLSGLIDLLDIRLHERYRFVAALHKSFLGYTPSVDFRLFQVADYEVQRDIAQGALLTQMETTKEKAVDAFLDDLRELAQSRRVVLIVDTVERLSYITEKWVFEEWSDPQDGKKKDALLTSSDMRSRTHQFLLDLVGLFDPAESNVTLILAGRPDDSKHGQIFFGNMEKAAKEKHVAPVEALFHTFTLKDTLDYFVDLSEEAQARVARLANPDDPQAHRLRQYAAMLAELADKDNDRYKVIALYTEGLPVRLALYIQLATENIPLPSQLKYSLAEACEWANLSPTELADNNKPLGNIVQTPALQMQRWWLEEEFIDALFLRPFHKSPVVDALQQLIRTPRGLNAEQLHFLLDSPPDQDPDRWRPDPNKLKAWAVVLEQIEKEYYFGKRRSGWDDVAELLRDDMPTEEMGAAMRRVGLQDELYTIFANHMGLFDEPFDAELEEVRQFIRENHAEDIERYKLNRSDEMEIRRDIYNKLSRWASYQHKHYLAIKRKYLEQDELEFERDLRLNDNRTYSFRPLHDDKVASRSAVNTAIAIFEVERLVYDLLLDPEYAFNTTYIILEDEHNKAARQEEDFWAQAEVWRILNDDSLMHFIDLRGGHKANERHEPPLDVLRRAARQEDIARWIRRFATRGPYIKAIEFGEAAQRIIKGLEKAGSQEMVWRSWNHSLAHSERQLWIEYARIRANQGVVETLDNLNKIIERLEQLRTNPATADISTPGFPLEWGFLADKAQNIPDHPGLPRLRYLQSLACKIAGDAHRAQGQMKRAVRLYGRALDLFRDDRNVAKSQLANILNNLAMALSELGQPSINVCLDGLALRKITAEELPMANSYNTLALIYDDMGRYEDAPLLSAKAIAYCRRTYDQRQLGLSLRQMAESLRHLADRVRTGQRAGTSPENYFTTAEDLLRQAHAIFSDPKTREPRRLAEVEIELGSLYRDRLHPDNVTPSLKTRERYYREAKEALERGEREGHLARQHYLALDAKINHARALYYYDHTKREDVIDILKEVKDSQIYYSSQRPGDNYEDPSQDPEDRGWVHRQQSRASLITSWIEMDKFKARIDFYKEQYPEEDDPLARQKREAALRQDEDAKIALEAGVVAYARALHLAQRYSPFSRAIPYIRDDLYKRIHRFNKAELEMFHEQLNKAWNDPKGGGKNSDMAKVYEMIDQFIHDYFGFAPHPPAKLGD